MGESIIGGPLNELDDEIKAYIYNPTDPDSVNLSHHDVNRLINTRPLSDRNKPHKVRNHLTARVAKNNRNFNNSINSQLLT